MAYFSRCSDFDFKVGCMFVALPIATNSCEVNGVMKEALLGPPRLSRALPGPPGPSWALLGGFWGVLLPAKVNDKTQW